MYAKFDLYVEIGVIFDLEARLRVSS